MRDSSAYDSQYATRIVERLLSDDGERSSLDLENDIVISDLERDADSFSTDLAIVDDFGVGIPAIMLSDGNGYVPVSLHSMIWPYAPYLPHGRLRRWWRDDPDLYYLFRRRFARLFEGDSPFVGFHTIRPVEARESFTRRAINFLVTRIAAVRNFRERQSSDKADWGKTTTLKLPQTAGGNKVTTPGCYFSVSTDSDGLRVFWSGAYYISSNYFSHPTSPVTSVLQTGTYVFGVDGGVYGNKIEWDTNAVVTLPGTPFVHLSY